MSKEYILNSPKSLNYITDNIVLILKNKIAEYKKLFKIEDMEPVHINYFDDIDQFRNFIYELRGEKESLPQYAIGTYDKGMINAFIEPNIDVNSNTYKKKLYLASHELFHIFYMKYILKNDYSKRIVWYDEGMAQFLSGEKDELLDLETFKKYILKVKENTLIVPNLNELKHGDSFCNDNYNGYDLSYLCVRYLSEILTIEEFKCLMSDFNKIKEYGSYIINEMFIYYDNFFKKQNNKNYFIKQKIQEILKLIEENHIDMYFNITKEELDKYVERILNENEINNEYDLYYYVNVIIKQIFGKFDSHTKIEFNNGDFYLAVRFKYIDNKLYIIRVTDETKELLYGQVLKINDIDINILIDEIKNMTAYSTEEYLIQQIEMSLINGYKLKSLPSIDSNVDEFEFEINNNDKIIKQTLTRSEGKFLPINKPKSNYSYEIINDTMLIVYKKCREDYENQMIDFVKEITNKSNELKINKFIVDIRGNLGGNSRIINPLIEFLNGKEVVTLVDEYVFSSGSFAVFDLKNIGSKFIGTRIGTTLNHFGYVSNFKYDNFFIVICNTYFYMDTTYEYENFKYADTKEKFKELKKDKKMFIPQIFEPDYYCKKGIEDYKNGIDSELEMAINILNEQNKLSK